MHISRDGPSNYLGSSASTDIADQLLAWCFENSKASPSRIDMLTWPRKCNKPITKVFELHENERKYTSKFEVTMLNLYCKSNGKYHIYLPLGLCWSVDLLLWARKLPSEGKRDKYERQEEEVKKQASDSDLDVKKKKNTPEIHRSSCEKSLLNFSAETINDIHVWKKIYTLTSVFHFPGYFISSLKYDQFPNCSAKNRYEFLAYKWEILCPISPYCQSISIQITKT